MCVTRSNSSLLKKYSRLFFDQLWQLMPHTCERCMAPLSQHHFLCVHCRDHLASVDHPCRQCGLPMSEGNAQLNVRCGRCISNPPAYDYVHAPFIYQPPVSTWLKRYKDHFDQRWEGRLLQLMQQQPPFGMAHVDALAFVPSSRTSMWKRGFNATELWAKALSKHYGIPLLQGSIQRIGNHDQRTANAKQRWRNLNKAFVVKQATHPYGHVLIVEDVVTTGATAHAFAKLLKQQGAHTVGVWALCRTLAPMS